MWIVFIFILPILGKLLYGYSNHIKYLTYFFLYCFLNSVIVTILTPVYLFRIGDVRNAALSARVAKHLTKLYGIKWIIVNENVLAEERGAVIVANHQSILDILGMFNVWEKCGKMAAVAKKELLYVFPFGPINLLIGTIFIDRKNPKKAHQSLMKCTEAMVKNETKIWIFPEGSRNNDRSKLMPFKKGAFNMAIAAQVPIIPAVYSPYYFIDHDNFIFEQGGEVIMKILDPIPTSGLKNEDVSKLMDQVRDVMDKEYQLLRKEIESRHPRK